MATLPHTPGLCWVHLKGLRFFVRLGVSPEERIIGHNLTIDCSLQIPYQNTQNNIKNTLDYGLVIQAMEDFLGGKSCTDTHFFLLEYLAEQLSKHVLEKFSNIQGLFLRIQKAYLPLPHTLGEVSIEILKIANVDPLAPISLTRAP